VHADGQEDGRSVGGHIQDITDDGVFLNFDHGSPPFSENGMKIVYPIPSRFSIEEVKKTEKGSEKGALPSLKTPILPQSTPEVQT
jgi:hypothetical protein